MVAKTGIALAVYAQVMRVLHVIVGLQMGGAETMLKRLITSFSDSPNYNHIIVSLTDEGQFGEQLRSNGIEIYSLHMSSTFSLPSTFWRLVNLIRLHRPDIVQTWMYHGDFLGGLAARVAGSFPVVWNVRSTAIPQGRFSVTYWLVRVCALLSNTIPRRIICCANSAKSAHIELKYPESKMIVIPNGYDFSVLKRNSSSAESVREKLGVVNGDVVIGVVGRFDALKDFKTFVSAASHLVNVRENIKFLMVGRGNEWSNSILCSWIETAKLMEKFYLVGQQDNVVDYLSAMDIFCLSSISEGFPNVLVEAMAIALPCVVTRAGDAPDILDDDDFVVPVQDSISLASTLMRVCDFDPVRRRMLGERNALKVRKNYRIESIRKEYEKVYEEVVRI